MIDEKPPEVIITKEQFKQLLGKKLGNQYENAEYFFDWFGSAYSDDLRQIFEVAHDENAVLFALSKLGKYARSTTVDSARSENAQTYLFLENLAADLLCKAKGAELVQDPGEAVLSLGRYLAQAY